MANDKVAVVAGVGPGLGARFVETLAREGASPQCRFAGKDPGGIRCNG
jgi:hypothetical protein